MGGRASGEVQSVVPVASVVKLLGGRVHLLRAMWKICVVTCLMTMYGIEPRFTQLDVGRDPSGGRQGHPKKPLPT